MFWSDWGDKPHIGRANMDGTDSRMIITDNLGWPNALAVSHATEEIFFGDAREDFIAVANLDGSNIRTILSRAATPAAKLHHIFALSVFEDYVYWSDWETKVMIMMIMMMMMMMMISPLSGATSTPGRGPPPS